MYLKPEIRLYRFRENCYYEIIFELPIESFPLLLFWKPQSKPKFTFVLADFTRLVLKIYIWTNSVSLGARNNQIVI